MEIDFAKHVQCCTPRIYPYECQSADPTFIKNKGVFQNYHRVKPHILINRKKRKFDVLVATVDVDCKDNYKAIHFMHKLNKGRKS